MKLKLRPGSLPASLPFLHPASLVATFFGAGLIPIAAGTWGSLAALLVGVPVGQAWGSLGLLLAAAIATVAGAWASGVVVRESARPDPGLIVIDEVAGMFLALAFAPLTWWGILLAFLLFRAADIFKPFPAGWLDRNLHGGWGVMLDDLVAGLYAGVVTYLLSEYVARDLLASLGL